VWLIAIATSVLFFSSIVAHELGHSLVAQRSGIQVKSITLFVFGGIARIAREPSRPLVEAAIALAGPLVSAVLGGALLGGGLLLEDVNEPAAALLEYLALINLTVAVFNLVPGFPLDGGRVFRAAVWAVRKDFTAATKIAASVGKLVGLLFILGGLAWVILGNNWVNGVWMAFIGWFLINAATQGYRQTALREALKGVPVRRVMTADIMLVPRRLDLRTLVENHIYYSGRRLFLVGENGSWEGMLSAREIRRVPRHRWRDTRVGDVMVPAAKLRTVHPDEEVLRAIEIMDDSDVGLVPVSENGAVVGLVGRDSIFQFMRSKARSEAPA